jgi:hypothetical protein
MGGLTLNPGDKVLASLGDASGWAKGESMEFRGHVPKISRRDPYLRLRGSTGVVYKFTAKKITQGAWIHVNQDEVSGRVFPDIGDDNWKFVPTEAAEKRPTSSTPLAMGSIISMPDATRRAMEATGWDFEERKHDGCPHMLMGQRGRIFDNDGVTNGVVYAYAKPGLIDADDPAYYYLLYDDGNGKNLEVHSADDAVVRAMGADRWRLSTTMATEGWVEEGHEWIGTVLAKSNEGGWVCGRILCFLPPSKDEETGNDEPPLFRFVHCDGDFEDLEQNEVDGYV